MKSYSPLPSTAYRLLTLIAPFKWWIALAALLGFATIGSSIGLMATAAYIISLAALHPSIAALQVAIVGVRFFGLSRGVFRYLERYVSHQVTFRLLARLRVWFYERLEPLAPARLQTHHSGDLLARFVADIDSLEHFYVRVIAPPLVAGLVILVMGLWLAAFDLQLALVGVGLLLLTGTGIPALTHRLSRNTAHRLVTVRAGLNTVLVDTVQGAADLLVMGQVGGQQRQVHQLGGELVSLQNKMARVTGLHMALSGLLANGAVLVMLLLAIPLVSAGQLNGVYLAVLALAVLAAFEAVGPLPEAWQRLEGSLTAARRLFELVDAAPAITDPLTSSAPHDHSLNIENLHFCYTPNDPPVLTGVNLTVPDGSLVAIVGPSGAGKSTLVNLLLRFWEYQEGRIELGGYDLRSYQAEESRRLIGVVTQRTHLFNATIRDNLRLARPTANEDELNQVIQQVQLANFIQTLPKGLDTWIGEQGLRLSGGERQRLALARALLQTAPILILDEPTAHLDSLTERAILQTIHALRQGRTTLLITHRLVGLEVAAEIVVLQAGRVVERGRHSDLIQTRGIYWRMYHLQNSNLSQFTS